MTSTEFQQQIARLKSEFGEKSYSVERVSLIWKEVKELPIEWMKKTVSEFIGSQRFAPLLSEFREASFAERARVNQDLRRQQKQQAEEFMQSLLTRDEITLRCDFIRRRLMKNISDQEYSSFLQQIRCPQEA